MTDPKEGCMDSPRSLDDDTTSPPVARTVKRTCEHYDWTRTFAYGALAKGDLIAVKAGRRTLITSESADRLFASLPQAVYRAPPARPTAAERRAA